MVHEPKPREVRRMTLRVGVGQFPVNADVEKNLAYIRRQIASAARQRADVVLFSETALSGYAGVDFDSFAGYDWALLRRSTQQVMEAARQHGMWVILGSNHRLSGKNKPHNSLYVIDSEGRVLDRYDKRLCPVGDLAHYRPGTRAVTVRIQGVICGLLICHEWRYPEVYRQYKKLKADVIFQSWYDVGLSKRDMRAKGNDWARVIPAAAQGHAACNHFWICGSNTSKPYSCFGGFVVRPDGTFLRRQLRHRAGVMVCTIDTNSQQVDAAAHLRKKAMQGMEDWRPELKDQRSVDRRCV